MRPTRRSLLGAPALLALAACEGRAQTPVPAGPLPPLKSLAPFPVGAAINADALNEPAYVAALTTHFDQVTADWEMKMEVVLKKDGALDFALPDRIAGFAREKGLRLYGHTLIWYAQEPVAFERILGDRAKFENAFETYIRAVAGRYRGQVVGWDVVNEAVDEEGDGYRGGYWSQVFGMDYVRRAFELAREADPQAVLFLNDYHLERRPKKRVKFLRLAEQLLKQGAPLQGLGTQSHLDVDVDLKEIAKAMRDIGSLGLPIHVSELDVSLGRSLVDLRSDVQLLDRQARVVDAVVSAFVDLPEAQRFALTTWGVRDQDSWLRRAPNDRGGRTDRPLLLDDAGRPKPAFRAAAERLRA